MKGKVDSFRHKGLRKQLIDSIRRKGINDEKVLSAMEKIPRHFFMDSSFLEFAYQDKPFPIGSGQTISQPYTVAFQTMLLQAGRSHKVLEIGTGSGYQASVLAEMGAKVFTIERQRKLYLRTKAFMDDMPWRIRMFLGDGNEGLPSFAPFDRILVTAAAPQIAEAWKSQLKPGGILVIPLGGGVDQVMLRLTKNEDDSFDEERFGTFRFVPILDDIGED
ncbi:MAG: protein-L-isoaspartate(D-aspartate) O-methyltransferase [Bacteroidales bacterium]|jgi:protein-L-isoaspartate(D-aspartate) O-methyltransferase|nr:protein-L-isoaspartate(D-aspartate) O-methyltransferase [Bacteroidales bacterium]MCK9448132.1 protein-L-isoaspartate(D-aspartate) O-methyltransferase [Bacteroidales bacterium]MDD3701212.1 protein-L-isoaspartate(D-aspartate) O-methyltransferase [Bacteroidales bacterium]MDY0368342.1 protein-L-isoaspartate(D-aspartate) O-methyltransferase [Bacteroidales bacterium]